MVRCPWQHNQRYPYQEQSLGDQRQISRNHLNLQRKIRALSAHAFKNAYARQSPHVAVGWRSLDGEQIAGHTTLRGICIT